MFHEFFSVVYMVDGLANKGFKYSFQFFVHPTGYSAPTRNRGPKGNVLFVDFQKPYNFGEPTPVEYILL